MLSVHGWELSPKLTIHRRGIVGLEKAVCNQKQWRGPYFSITSYSIQWVGSASWDVFLRWPFNQLILHMNQAFAVVLQKPTTCMNYLVQLCCPLLIWDSKARHILIQLPQDRQDPIFSVHVEENSQYRIEGICILIVFHSIIVRV